MNDVFSTFPLFHEEQGTNIPQIVQPAIDKLTRTRKRFLIVEIALCTFGVIGLALYLAA